MNRIVGIDTFYLKIKKTILFVKGYTENKYLAFIIQMCRLKPYNILINGYDEKITLHRKWVDEKGNSLKIIKNKRIRIILNDLSIDRKKLTSTDLYEGLAIDKIASMSRCAFILQGKEEESYKTHVVISFLGIDNYLRTFVYEDGLWIQFPSLYLGMKVLKYMAIYHDIRYFKNLGLKETVIYPCTKQQTWLTCWPPGKDFVSLMEEQDNPVLELYKGKINTHD